MDPSPSAAPRVFVPITPPDSSLPTTYAVLQFLGFSSPPDISPSSSSAASFTLARQHPHPHPHPQQQQQQQLHLAWPAPPALQDLPSPASDLTSSRKTSPVSENSSSSGDSKDSSREKDKKFVSLKPAPMKKAGVASGVPSSPGGKKSPRAAVATAISVSHTERETIVHTHCSNFREVVHQLTGASSEDKGLLPVTLPARVYKHSGDGGGSKQESAAKAEIGQGARTADLGARKPATKLIERRKTLKNLENLTTSCRALPPLVPSPVTPLPSDFEKICLPLTPTTSQGSTSVSFPPKPSENPSVEIPRVIETQATTTEDLAIGGKGFFLHSQRPRKSDPTLLNLFPESPACSPREQ